MKINWCANNCIKQFVKIQKLKYNEGVEKLEGSESEIRFSRWQISSSYQNSSKLFLFFVTWTNPDGTESPGPCYTICELIKADRISLLTTVSDFCLSKTLWDLTWTAIVRRTCPLYRKTDLMKHLFDEGFSRSRGSTNNKYEWISVEMCLWFIFD